MKLNLSAEPLFAIIISFTSALSGYLIGIVTFPELSNEHLSQTLIDIKILTIITCSVFFIILLFPAVCFSNRKYAKWFWISGLISMFLFFLTVFKLFFPFENKYVIHTYECDVSGKSRFLIGKEFNSDFIKDVPDAGLKTVETLIYGTGCSPHKIWTAKSIENNYNTLISYYIICIFLFICMVFLLLQAVLCLMGIPVIKTG